jgi:hypothetical protein
VNLQTPSPGGHLQRSDSRLRALCHSHPEENLPTNSRRPSRAWNRSCLRQQEKYSHPVRTQVRFSHHRERGSECIPGRALFCKIRRGGPTLKPLTLNLLPNISTGESYTQGLRRELPGAGPNRSRIPGRKPPHWAIQLRVGSSRGFPPRPRFPKIANPPRVRA